MACAAHIIVTAGAAPPAQLVHTDVSGTLGDGDGIASDGLETALFGSDAAKVKGVTLRAMGQARLLSGRRRRSAPLVIASIDVQGANRPALELQARHKGIEGLLVARPHVRHRNDDEIDGAASSVALALGVDDVGARLQEHGQALARAGRRDENSVAAVLHSGQMARLRKAELGIIRQRVSETGVNTPALVAARRVTSSPRIILETRRSCRPLLAGRDAVRPTVRVDGGGRSGCSRAGGKVLGRDARALFVRRGRRPASPYDIVLIAGIVHSAFGRCGRRGRPRTAADPCHCQRDSHSAWRQVSQ